MKVFPIVQPRKFLNAKGRKYLSADVTISELKDAVFSIEDSRSPGPDGFSSKVFKPHWDMLQDSLFATGTTVFQSRKIAQELNHNFTTLIPKKDKP